jgi:hypothetical protein
MREELLFLVELVGVQADRKRKDALLTQILSLLAEMQNAIDAKIKPDSEREFKQKREAWSSHPNWYSLPIWIRNRTPVCNYRSKQIPIAPLRVSAGFKRPSSWSLPLGAFSFHSIFIKTTASIPNWVQAVTMAQEFWFARPGHNVRTAETIYKPGPGR